MKNNHVKGICMGDDKRIYIYDPNISTDNVPAFDIYYELATPVETDVSSYITDNDKFLEVEALGTITFTNTYEQEVPSEITYLTEVAK